MEFITLAAIVFLYFYFFAETKKDPLDELREQLNPTSKPTEKDKIKERKRLRKLKASLATQEEAPTQPYSNMFMSKLDKQTYLQSSEWYTIKQQRLDIANNTCESTSCTNSSNLHLHHLHYYNLGAEEIDDVIILCETHHQLQHDAYGYNRQTTYLPIIVEAK